MHENHQHFHHSEKWEIFHSKKLSLQLIEHQKGRREDNFYSSFRRWFHPKNVSREKWLEHHDRERETFYGEVFPPLLIFSVWNQMTSRGDLFTSLSSLKEMSIFSPKKDYFFPKQFCPTNWGIRWKQSLSFLLLIMLRYIKTWEARLNFRTKMMTRVIISKRSLSVTQWRREWKEEGVYHEGNDEDSTHTPNIKREVAAGAFSFLSPSDSFVGGGGGSWSKGTKKVRRKRCRGVWVTCSLSRKAIITFSFLLYPPVHESNTFDSKTCLFISITWEAMIRENEQSVDTSAPLIFNPIDAMTEH